MSCDNIHDCRTIQNIVFSCASTMFLCTWVALHLDVPKDPWEPGWKRMSRRIGWTILALLAPEVILFMAFKDWTNSSNQVKERLEYDPHSDWTETHALLVRMGGVQVVSPEHRLRHDAIRGIPLGVELPKKDEILERGQGDDVAKAFAVIQTLWFAVQAANRVSQGLIVTELELTTLGHVVLNIFTYWCWWNKPLNPRFPVEVSLEKDDAEPVRRNNGRNNADSKRPNPRLLPIRVRMGAYLHKSLPMDGEVFRGLVMIEVDGKAALTVIPLVSIVGGMFGAVHCLAWNSAFPSRIEHILWRVSAAVVTAVPSLSTVLVVGEIVTSWIGEYIPCVEEPMGNVIIWILYLSPYVYCIARICLLVLALITLRDVPYKAFETPSWTAYIPHIG